MRVKIEARGRQVVESKGVRNELGAVILKYYIVVAFGDCEIYMALNTYILHICLDTAKAVHKASKESAKAAMNFR